MRPDALAATAGPDVNGAPGADGANRAGGANGTSDAVGRVPADAAASAWRSLLERYFDWRNRLLADPGFHRRARRNPLLRIVARRRARAMFDLCSGFVYSQVLSSCVELKLFEALRARPLGTAEVARAIGLGEEATATLLRSATSLRLVQQRAGERWSLGIHGAAFLANPGVRTMVEHHAFLYRDLADPVALLRGGVDETLISLFWDYAGARREGFRPDAEGTGTAPYTALMSASQAMIAEQIVDVYPLAQHQRLMDVGGGDGTFLRSVAAAAPDLELSLFDLPPVAAAARARFEAWGEREVTCTGGDAFEDALPGGCDAISLVRVVHDHDDDRALLLLERCREALPPGGTLLLAEPMARERVGDPATDAYFGMYLQAMGRGRPRTAAELEALLERAGFRRVRDVRTPMPMLTSLLVARAP